MAARSPLRLSPLLLLSLPALLLAEKVGSEKPGRPPTSCQLQGGAEAAHQLTPALEGQEAEEEECSALLQHHGAAGVARAPKRAASSSQGALLDTSAAATKANETSGFVVTAAIVLAASAVGGALEAMALKKAASGLIHTALNMIKGGSTFNDAVGLTGLPLTVGIINDTPNPVKYSRFEQLDGRTWGRPALLGTLKPGEMFAWYLYAHTMGVEATIRMDSGDTTWSIAVAQFRAGNLFTECDRLRCNVVRSKNMTEALTDLCSSYGNGGAGISVEGGYKIAISLSAAGSTPS